MNVDIVKDLRCFFVENERSARRALRRMDPSFDLASIAMHRLDKNTSPEELDGLLEVAIGAGRSGIMSEAGMPGIADPGHALIALAHVRGMRVEPLIGPNSMMLALAASGMSGQAFVFHGYLPRKPHELRRTLQKISMDARTTGYTQLFMETPYRNMTLLEEVIRTCPSELRLCIAVNVTQPKGSVRTRTVADWARNPPNLKGAPTVFALAP